MGSNNADARGQAAPAQVVLVRPGALGDALLALPMLALVRRAWPRTQLMLIARPDVLPLVRSSGLADQTYSYDLPAWSALFASGAAAVEPLAGEVMLDASVAVWAPDPEGVIEQNARALGATRALVAPGRPVPSDRTHLALALARTLQ